MSSTATEIRPFRVSVPEAELVVLHRRLQGTRWPEKETVADQSQGVPLAIGNTRVASSTRRASLSPLPPPSSPGEQYQAPRSWAEQAYPNLIYFNEVDRGGHFAAWEQSQLFSEELRAAFRSVR
jgi:hypothetical protein